jgi:transposase, IS5 family
MLRERSVGESLWEAVLPAELRELPEELGKVDAILDDDRFLAPFCSRLTAWISRPTIPIETYLRLMFLKHRYGLGYRRCARRSPIRLLGGASAGSRSMVGFPIRAR